MSNKNITHDKLKIKRILGYQHEAENVSDCVNEPVNPRFSSIGVNCQYVVSELVCGAGFGANVPLNGIGIPFASGVYGPAIAMVLTPVLLAKISDVVPGVFNQSAPVTVNVPVTEPVLLIPSGLFALIGALPGVTVP